MFSIVCASSKQERTGAELKRPFVQSNVNGRWSPTRPPNHATHPA